ncbi:hypothetical protein Tco_1511044 [Tanacetum coccineum]
MVVVGWRLCHDKDGGGDVVCVVWWLVEEGGVVVADVMGCGGCRGEDGEGGSGCYDVVVVVVVWAGRRRRVGRRWPEKVGEGGEVGESLGLKL